MRYKISKYCCLVFIIFIKMALGQTVSIPIKVSNNVGDAQVITIGIDPSATDGIDVALGEAVLPPLPPKEIFDARFKFPTTNNDYSTIDYRYGTKPPFSSNITYHLEVQPGLGTSVTLEWNMPKETSGVLKDKFGGIVINKTMSGPGSLIITNLALNKLEIIVQYNLTSSVAFENRIPTETVLYPNYPNPFNPETTIKYRLKDAGDVRLSLYDILGNELAVLVDEYQQAGTYNSRFSIINSQLSSGIYFYKLQTGKNILFKKMVIIK